MSAEQSRAQTVSSWLDHRSEPAPPALRARIAHAVDALPEDTAVSVSEISARAGVDLLARLLTEGCDTRSAASDLLAADALVTYAFEAFAEDAAASARAISERAATTMLHIAQLGGDA